MKVIMLKPKSEPEIIEVESIKEINALVQNIDENGNGYDHAGTDIRMEVGPNIDLYCNEFAAVNLNLEENLAYPGGFGIIHGNIVFAGYDNDKYKDSGACSLNDEQIKYVMELISNLKL